jgi:hypothetical protein
MRCAFLYLIILSIGAVEMVPSVDEVFVNELKKSGIRYEGPDTDGLYQVFINGGKFIISLENVGRNYVRDGDKEVVVNLVNKLRMNIDIPVLEKAKDNLRISLEPADSMVGNALRYKLTDKIFMQIVIYDPGRGSLMLVHDGILQKWGMSGDEVYAIALDNMRKVLDNMKPELIGEKGGFKLFSLPIQGEFKASSIISPNFKEIVSDEIGWPVLVVVPCRDFIYLVSEEDGQLVNQMGKVVREEYNGSGYPISLQVLRISDDGVNAIGEFPKDQHN